MVGGVESRSHRAWLCWEDDHAVDVVVLRGVVRGAG